MKYCLDIETTIPFVCSKNLRKIAQKSVGENNIMDMSQGEPGYGFSPSVRSRKFFGFLAFLDVEFNDYIKEKSFIKYSETELNLIEKIIVESTYKNFSQKVAKNLIDDWNFFIKELETIIEKQDLNLDRFQIMQELFKYSNLMGGRYPQPTGNILLNAAFAQRHSEQLGIKVSVDELITTIGASHAIGTTFKALGEEGIGFLKEGDTIVMTSPVYAPYNDIFIKRGINVLSLSIDTETGEVDKASFEKIEKHSQRIKAIILISPNNPTGFASTDALYESIIKLAESNNSIIITDEVYLGFFENAKSIATYPEARKRLILIDSISKIERSTGVRSGDIYISNNANEFISNYILKDFLTPKFDNIRNLLQLAKSPGGKNIGVFQHITGIAGPSVAISLSHMILGKEEKKQYIADLKKKGDIFYKTLGLKHNGNIYYGIIDLAKIESEKSKERDIELILELLAKQGVVLMPANMFFSQEDKKKRDTTRMMRISLPNLSFKNTQQVAKIIKKVCTI